MFAFIKIFLSKFIQCIKSTFFIKILLCRTILWGLFHKFHASILKYCTSFAKLNKFILFFFLVTIFEFYISNLYHFLRSILIWILIMKRILFLELYIIKLVTNLLYSEELNIVNGLIFYGISISGFLKKKKEGWLGWFFSKENELFSFISTSLNRNVNDFNYYLPKTMFFWFK